MTTAELYLSPPSVALSHTRGRRRTAFAVAMWIVAAALPLVGLVSLLLRASSIRIGRNPQVHFTVFLTVGIGVSLSPSPPGKRRTAAATPVYS